MSSCPDAPFPSWFPRWIFWLRCELASFPGRKQMTIRLVVTVVLVTIISMALQVPQLAFSAFFVFFVTKENRALTLLTGVVMMVGITVSTVVSLVLYQGTFDDPELRIPVMAGLVFAGMFLSRTFVIGPLGFVIGFFTALMQTIGESAPDTDSLVRGVLWLWVSVVYPIALTIFINQVLFPADPWPLLVGALKKRLDTAAGVLDRIIREGRTGGQTNYSLVELATRGTSPMLALLHFAESKSAVLKRRHTSLAAAISASDHLLNATAQLEFRPEQALSDEDLLCARAARAEIAELTAVLPECEPILGPRKTAVPRAAMPQLRELQFAIESFRDGLIRYLTAEQTPAVAPARKSLFSSDAFTNPAHVHFALKVTLAAMTCYLIYSGLGWPGISTAFVTCCFIALENTAATIRKGWLRLIGCATGGFFGYLAIIFAIPHMESLSSLVLLTAVGAALAGWVTAGTDRISYGGLQAAFAFYMCIFQGFAPETDFTIVRDRLVGIVLGIIVSATVYRYIWPEHAVDALRVTLARVLRALGRMVIIPHHDPVIAAEQAAADQLFGAIKKDLDNSLRLSEVMVIENVILHGEEHLSTQILERLTSHTQALSLMTLALLSQSKLEEWHRLDPEAQRAEIVLRERLAEQFECFADFVESGKLCQSAEVQSAFLNWGQAVARVKENDRPRLVRRLVVQVQDLT